MSPAAASTVSGVSSGDGESQRDFGRTVEVCREQSRRHPTVPAAGGSGEPRGDHDRLDDHRVMMTDARLGALGCGASVGRPASVD